MSGTAAQFLATCDSLEPQEQHELLTELLRRGGELPNTFLTDNNLVGFADDLFQTLDAEESDDRKSNAE